MKATSGVAPWLRRLRRLVADTPADVHVHVAAGAILVTRGYDEDALSQDNERAAKAVATIIAPRWREDDP